MSAGVTGSIPSETLSFLPLCRVQTSHQQFSASSSRCLRFPAVAFHLLSVKQPKGEGGGGVGRVGDNDRGKTTFPSTKADSEAKNCSFRLGWGRDSFRWFA